MKHKTFSWKAQNLMFALSLAATAALAQSPSAQVVRQLDALDSKTVSAAPLPQPAQIRSLVQSAEQRVLPRVITLPELTTKAALPAPAPAPGRPVQIGVARALPDAANAAATANLLAWTRAADGSQRAAISVRAPGAKGLRMGLLVDQLPPGTRLRAYAPNAAQTTEIAAAEVLRTIQTNLNAGDNSADAHTYWLPIVEGAEAALEIELPAGVNPTQLKVSLPIVSHLTALPTDTKAIAQASGSCNIDVMCTPDYEAESRAVAGMSYSERGGSFFCTGTLLNNTKQDRTPYFLTADHCIWSQTNASSLVTYWNYRLTDCNGSWLDAQQIVPGGAQLLYNSANTDTAFLRLNASAPANAVFAGWDASTPAAVGTAVFGIHHPKGDPQKLVEGEISEFANCWSIAYTIGQGNMSCTSSDTPGGATFYVMQSLRGTIEGTSSGSALFTYNGRKVIGQLFGGSSLGCGIFSHATANYGRFDRAFDDGQLAQWLSPPTAAHTVTASAGAGGTINPAGNERVSSGTAKTFTVTPNAGYGISVGGTCGGTLSGSGPSYTYTTKVVTGDCTVAVEFISNSHTTTTNPGPGGTLTPSSAAVRNGAPAIFTVTPNLGYKTVSVSGKGDCAGTLNGNIYTTKAITADCTVSATFIQETHTITSSAGPGGKVSPAGTFSVPEGSRKAFTLTPDKGYIFETITGDCRGYNPSENELGTFTFETYPIYGDCTFKAEFTPKPTTTYTVTTRVSNMDGGTITPAGAISASYGDIKTFTLTPKNNKYKITSASGCGGTLTGNTYTTGPITSDCFIDASFYQAEFEVTASAGPGGTISPSGISLVPRDATKTFTITPDAGYYPLVAGTCKGPIYMGVAPEDKLDGNTYTTKKINADCTVTVEFTTKVPVTVTTSINPSGAGTIIPETVTEVSRGADGSIYTNFIVAPNTGYRIKTVSGCGGPNSSNDTPYGVDYSFGPIFANCTVTVIFDKLSYTVATSVSPSGTGTISPANPIVTAGQTQILTLSPSPGYTISSVGGSCGGTLDGNIYTTKAITANCTVTAAFVRKGTQPTITASVSGTGGTINPSGAVSVTSGMDKVFTVTPNAGYGIFRVAGTCGGTLNGNTYTTRKIGGDCTVVAEFTEKLTVTASVSGTGGTISPLGATPVNYKGSLTFKVTPNPGYAINTVSGCGKTYSGNGITTAVDYPFDAITRSCPVVATFVPISQPPTTYPVGGTISGLNGSVTLNLASTHPTASPQTQTLKRDTNGSYTFPTPLQAGSNWTVSVTGQPANQKCTVANSSGTDIRAPVTNVNVTCSGTITYTVSANPGPGGTISPPSVKVNLGEKTTLTVKPNPNYYIAAISGCNGAPFTGSATNTTERAYATGSITGDCTVSATFAPVRGGYTVGGTISGLNGSVTLALIATNPDSSQTRTLTANGSYTFTTPLLSGSYWTARIATQPTNQTCIVTDGWGNNIGANVTNVNVTCTDNQAGTFTGGAVSIRGFVSSLGYTLIATPDGFSPNPGNYTFQWLRNGANIPGATVRTYTIVAADAWQQISVRVTASKAGLADKTVTAPAVTISGNHFTGGTVSISGIASVGNTLSASASGFSPTPDSYTYDWVRSGVIMSTTSGPNISYYRLSETDAGRQISVRVTVQKAGYIDAAVTSPVVTVSSGPITGTGGTVTSSVGSGSGSGSITPLGATTVNSGATASYTLTPGAGYMISWVGGTCGGTLSGNIYTTRPITANCTVVANFTR